MNKRVWLAGILGAVAIFFWTFVAHMFLPLGEAGIKQIENEQALLTSMVSTLPEGGLYMFPRMAPGTTEAQYNTQVANGPSGLLLYSARRNFSFGKALGIEFGTELALALIAVYLLSKTSINGFAGRLGFYAVLGLLVAIATNVSYWNWYAFPTTYTAAYMFTSWMGMICAGLVAAAMKVGSSRRAAAAAA
jgi:hypothetical protein